MEPRPNKETSKSIYQRFKGKLGTDVHQGVGCVIDLQLKWEMLI